MSNFLDLIRKTKGKGRRDLKVFLSMSSNQLSALEQDIALHALTRVAERKKADDAFFKEQYLSSVPGEDAEVQAQKWNRAKHRIYKALVHYLKMQKMREHPAGGILGIACLEEMGLTELQAKTVKKEKDKLAREKHPNDQLYQYLLSEAAVRLRAMDRQKDVALDQMERDLDCFFIEKKLRCLCERANRKNVLNQAYRQHPQLDLWMVEKLADSPTIKMQLYYHIHQMLTGQNPLAQYQCIDEMLKRERQALDDFSWTEGHGYLINFCIQQVNEWEIDFARHCLNHIEAIGQQAWVLTVGKPNPASFRNAVNMGIIAGDIPWCESFIDRWQSLFDQSGHENLVCLSKASLLFYKGEHKKCEQLLGQFSFRDRYHKLAQRHLELKLDFHKLTNGKYRHSAFESNLKGRKSFLQRQDWIPDDRKEKLTRFLQALAKLAKGKAVDVEDLRGQIYILDWMWLSAQMPDQKGGLLASAGYKNP
ncbi:MAG: hypothetical protein AAFV95_27150 [Bacteroidota bacterium]